MSISILLCCHIYEHLIELKISRLFDGITTKELTLQKENFCKVLAGYEFNS